MHAALQMSHALRSPQHGTQVPVHFHMCREGNEQKPSGDSLKRRRSESAFSWPIVLVQDFFQFLVDSPGRRIVDYSKEDL